MKIDEVAEPATSRFLKGQRSVSLAVRCSGSPRLPGAGEGCGGRIHGTAGGDG